MDTLPIIVCEKGSLIKLIHYKKDGNNYGLFNYGKEFIKYDDFVNYPDNIWITSDYYEFLKVTKKEIYSIKLNYYTDVVKMYFMGTFVNIENCDELKKIIEDEFKKLPNKIPNEITIHDNFMYARCDKSAEILDTIHRDIIKKNEELNMAIQAGPGTGKTTNLMNHFEESVVPKRNIFEKVSSSNTKKNLYLVYNKTMKEEFSKRVKSKFSRNKSIEDNIDIFTFDGFNYHIYKEYLKEKKIEIKFNINIKISDFCKDKKEYYKLIKKFFESKNYSQTIEDYVKEKEMSKKDSENIIKIWNDIIDSGYYFINIARKFVLIDDKIKHYLNKYNCIYIDEVQDIDDSGRHLIYELIDVPFMLVGDSNQSIYQFRKCINIFDVIKDDVRKNIYIIELYKTYRFGKSIVDKIMVSEKFNGYLISGRSKDTEISKYITNVKEYIYLAKTWRFICENAEYYDDIYIEGLNEKLKILDKYFNNIHRNNAYTATKQENWDEEEDQGICEYLKSLSLERYEEMKENLKKKNCNINKAKIKFYTIHKFKGKEAPIVRLDPAIKELEHSNYSLYNVAMSRCQNKLILQ